MEKPQCYDITHCENVFQRLTEDYYPDLVVVSYNEVESNVELQSVGMVTA